jgi:hypothetical protein
MTTSTPRHGPGTADHAYRPAPAQQTTAGWPPPAVPSQPAAGWPPPAQPTTPMQQAPLADSWPPQAHGRFPSPAAPAGRRRPVKHLVGYPVTAVVALLIGAAAAGGGEPAPTATADPATAGAAATSETGAAPAVPSSAAAKPAAAPADAGKPASASQLGKPVRDGKFEFTVTKIRPGVRQVGGSAFGVKAQGQFVLVSVTVENIGDEPQSLFGDNQKLFDAAGREYSADSEAAVYLADSNSLWEEINPGNTVDGVIVFDVPKGTDPTRLELHDSLFSGGVEVTL